MNVGGIAMHHAALQSVGAERLAEVDNTVMQIAATPRIIALAARPVLFVVGRSSGPIITHIVLAALLADLEVGVAVHLRDLNLRNARLAMQAIDVLADDVL